MEYHPLYPFHEDAERLQRFCKLPLHTGIGRIACHGDPNCPLAQRVKQIQQAIGQPDPPQQEYAASFLVPASGNCLIFLRTDSDHALSQNFGEGLTIQGTSSDGPFELICPQYYVKVASPFGDAPGWAIAAPVKEPTTITYGSPRPIAQVIGVINNFDFERGNLSAAECQSNHPVLRVDAGGHSVEFSWRPDRIHLKRLLDTGVLRSTSLTTFTFQSWEGATEGDLIDLAYTISSLCSIVVQQHTSVPVLTFLDGEGRVAKRVLRDAIESRYRPGSILFAVEAKEDGLAQLFQECFGEYDRLTKSDLWKAMAPNIASLQDPPYLEQKLASLMPALEWLIRNSLVEGGHSTMEQAKDNSLHKLIGAAKGTLRWVIPKHYTTKNLYEQLRNAVAHGNSMHNHASARAARAEFDKWRLFLIRRMLMRLGYTGQIASPQRGWASMSSVDDFSEENNSFGQP